MLLNSTDGDGAVALDSLRRFDRSMTPETVADRGVAAECERCVANLRDRLGEMHAMLSMAEHALAHRRRADPVLEPAPGLRSTDSLDRAVPVLSPSKQAVLARAEAAIRLMAEQWSAAVRKLENLGEACSPPPLPALDALGRDHGLVRLDRRTIELSPRHTEILVLLASNPRGLTTEQIALALYGNSGRPGTIRTALCRLRKVFGPWISNERNQVKLQIEADFLGVQRLLCAGRVREAARRYPAPLIPRSEAPGISDVRDELDAWVRSAVMTCGDQEALWAWLRSASGYDDTLAWKSFLADLDFSDPRRPQAVSRLAQLRTALASARRASDERNR